MSNKILVRILAPVFSIVALVGFVGAFISAVHYVKNDIEGYPQLLTIANILAGLVTGIVAADFGIPAPQGSTTKSLLLGRGLPTEQKLRNAIALLFAVTYLVVGAVAIFYWTKYVERSTPASVVVKNTATVWLGILVAVVRNYLTKPGDSQQSSRGTDY